MVITLSNGYNNGLWKQALKTLISSITSVLIVNFADPKGISFSWEWWKHCLIALFTVTLLNEARYWYNWANMSNGNTINPIVQGIKTDEKKNPLSLT